MFCEKNDKFSSQLKAIAQVVSLEIIIVFWYAAKGSSHFISQNTLKVPTDKLRLTKIYNFYCFIGNILKWNWHLKGFKSAMTTIRVKSWPWFMIRHQHFEIPLLLHNQCKYWHSENTSTVKPWFLNVLVLKQLSSHQAVHGKNVLVVITTRRLSSQRNSLNHTDNPQSNLPKENENTNFDTYLQI